MDERSSRSQCSGCISKHRKYTRATRSTVKHSISRVVNTHRMAVPTPLFVRTDSIFVDVQDVFGLVWSPSTSEKQLSSWKRSCHNAHCLKALILERGGSFAQRVTPYDIVCRKWISPMSNSILTGRARLCASAVGMCVILNLLRTSRRIQALESTYHYFENVANGNQSIDLMYDDHSTREAELSTDVKSLLHLQDTPFVNWDLSHEAVPSDPRIDVNRADDALSSTPTSISTASTRFFR